jgi:hypothetical protein
LGKSLPPPTSGAGAGAGTGTPPSGAAAAPASPPSAAQPAPLMVRTPSQLDAKGPGPALPATAGGALAASKSIPTTTMSAAAAENMVRWPASARQTCLLTHASLLVYTERAGGRVSASPG